jgi:deazaflavin-dependent oxidoreductase (nitroreductase family)
VGGPLAGRDVLLLTTTGAKSGVPRLSPLVYFTIDDKMLIVGSFDGNDVDPGSVHNLRANARAHIEVGIEAYDVIARELPRTERDAVYPKSWTSHRILLSSRPVRRDSSRCLN